MRFWTKEEFQLVYDWFRQQKWYVQAAVGFLVGTAIGQLIEACA